MLVHPWDAGSAEEGLAFARTQGFGQLIAAGTGRRVPVVVPTQFLIDDGDDGADPVVRLHLARPNPIWPAIEENPAVVLAVAGDWAYIPAAWKAIGDEDPAWGVPTTFYAAAQLTGTARVVADAGGKADILRRQLADVEADAGAALVDPAEHARRLPGILGLEVSVEQVVTKFKYGGNLDEAHRAHIARNLTGRNGPGDDPAVRRTTGR